MNKTVLTLIERASRKGVAKVNAYYVDWYGDKRKTEKYRVEYKNGQWSLYHYETLTATVAGGVGKVVYGESRSDVDSINTFFNWTNGTSTRIALLPLKRYFSSSRKRQGNSRV